MKKIKQINKNLVYIIAGLLILISSFSYAYFNGRVTGAEADTTIAANSGIMQIRYDGGAAINVTSFSPSATAFATKNFTVTGNNNTDQPMYYNLSLVMDSNTFSDDALKYKLTSTNTGGNGSVIPSITTMKEIGTGARDIFLGNGSFTGPTDNKVHTYKLELFFPVTGGDQSPDQSKSFSAHIETREGVAIAGEYLTDSIFDDYGGSSNIAEAPAGTFANINGSTDNLMYKMEDDYGMSYYLRGAKDYINNNLIFAEYQWKIVRINGDGTIRLIYNGTCPDNSCTINTTGTSTEIGTFASFNTNSNDNKYLGYMFSPSGTSASTSQVEATTNVTSSNIKTTLENWYSTNISGTDYENYISDTLFCNDRQIGESDPGLGYGTSETGYAAFYRLAFNTPNLKCGLKNDRFTVSDTTIGNGVLSYPIGLLNADELVIAGLQFSTSNSTNYLYNNQIYLTLTPSAYFSYALVLSLNSTGSIGNQSANFPLGVRPVVSLDSQTRITGTGTSSDPYIVVAL